MQLIKLEMQYLLISCPEANYYIWDTVLVTGSACGIESHKL